MPSSSSLLKNPAGFTYIAVLVLVMIMGIMLGVTGQVWKMVADREREAELLFRGSQYRDAITRWYTPLPGQHVATPLRDLKDLLKDPRTGGTVRYLRRLYLDPMTDKEWLVVRDASQGIVGVSSSSEAQPIKQGNFPEEFKTFEGKSKYSDWQFVYSRTAPPGQQQATTPAQ
jgi:type II secretory pathway pseudopilin PulG